MTNDLKGFMSNMGILCETWLVVYNNFIQRGFDHKVALDHTRAFMTAFMEFSAKTNGGKE